MCKARREHLSEAAHNQHQGEEEKNLKAAEEENGLFSPAQRVLKLILCHGS